MPAGGFMGQAGLHLSSSTTSFHCPLIPSSLIHLSFPLISSLSFPPSSFFLQSLARCLVHATSRSRLTDGCTARGAEAIRHRAEWNRTGPMHYPDFKAAPRFFNLYFPGGGSWQRALSAFDQNPAPLCFQKCRDILHSFMLCLFSRAPGTFWEGEAPSQELFFFSLALFFRPSAWQVSAEETNPDSKCHHILWNMIAAVMRPQFSTLP